MTFINVTPKTITKSNLRRFAAGFGKNQLSLIALAAAGSLTIATGAQAAGLDNGIEHADYMFDAPGFTMNYARRANSDTVVSHDGQFLDFWSFTFVIEEFDIDTTFEGFAQSSFSLLFELTEDWDVGISVDSPYDYQHDWGVLRFFTGNLIVLPESEHYYSIESEAASLMLGWQVDENWRLIGGLTNETVNLSYNMEEHNGVRGYGMRIEDQSAYRLVLGTEYHDTDSDSNFSFVYHSEWTGDDIAYTETHYVNPTVNVHYYVNEEFEGRIRLPASAEFKYDTPTSEDGRFHLGVRWVDLTRYLVHGRNVASTADPRIPRFAKDSWTYTVGYSHQVDPDWNVSASYSYEPAQSGNVSWAFPSSGSQRLELGAVYAPVDENFEFNMAIGLTEFMGGSFTHAYPIFTNNGGFPQTTTTAASTAVDVSFGVTFRF